MLNKIIQTYQNSKLAVIKKFSDQNYDILDEPGFLDDGYIRMKIDGLKKEYAKLEDQLQSLLDLEMQEEDTKHKIAALLEQKNEIHFYIAFLASNSFNSVEFAIHLTRNLKTDFTQCLEALFNFKQGREGPAFELFENYFSKQREPLNHFLINKVYGLLLLNHHQLEKSAQFFRVAAEKRPEDHETHLYLIQAYEGLGNSQQMAVHQGILKLLGR